MSATPEEFGRAVLGPIIAEFCLRLANITSVLEVPEGTAMLFCARGGLRMLEAFREFGRTTGIESDVPAVPFMTSRLSAVRPALVPALQGRAEEFGPAAAAVIRRDFAGITTGRAVRALAGTDLVADVPAAGAPATPVSVLEALRHPSATDARESTVHQADLFGRHLHDSLSGADHALLVDTGLYGTTGMLLSEGFPHLRVSAALIAHEKNPAIDLTGVPTYGLTEHSYGYAPWRRSSSILRYWQFVEYLFEPDLPSVRSYEERDGVVRSNLEAVDDWQRRVLPGDQEAFAGVLRYLSEDLVHGGAGRALHDAPTAWRHLSRAIVWPTAADAAVLDVGVRSHDFGSDETWTAGQWKGPIAALRESVMWREGDIARSGTPLRLPLLATIQAGYVARIAVRSARRVTAGGQA